MSEDTSQNQVLAALLALSGQVTSIEKELAVNTNETTNIVKRLDTLNGSVAKHANDINVHTQSIALISQSLDRLTTQDNQQEDKRSGWLDWLLKGLVVFALIVLYTLLIHAHVLSPLLMPGN